MAVLILSDIHGNLNALHAVIQRAMKLDQITECAILGDVIDYGMRSNEVIDFLEKLPFPIICNIWGNHEQAVCRKEYHRFSSHRGEQSARNTERKLSSHSWDYLYKQMCSTYMDFEIANKKCLAIHGSMEDYYWESIDITKDLPEYQKYDYVFSGHSHTPCFVEKYYYSDNEAKRNKKKTIFVNPGSVGQPRNLNPMAQFAILDVDKEEIILGKAKYNILEEQSYFSDDVDTFYKSRLEAGI